MKKHVTLFALCIAALPLAALAQWVQTNGPGGGLVRDMVADPSNNVYLGTEAGIFKSSDGGQTWSASNTGLPNNFKVERMDTMGNHIILASNQVSGQALYMSSDQGATWQNIAPANDFLSGAMGVGHIGNRLYYANPSDFFNPRGIMYSDDLGANWDTIPTYMISPDLTPQPFVDWIGVADGYLYAFVQNSGLFRTNNSGGTWEPLTTYDAGYPPQDISAAPNRLYLVPQYGTDHYVSTDGGATWSTATVNGFVSPKQFYHHNGTTYAVSWYGGTFASTNNGSTWQPVSALGTGDHNRMLFNNGTLYHATFVFGEGLRRSTNNGSTWQPANQGFAGTRAMSLLSTPNYLFCSSYERSMFRTDDSGNNWQRVHSSPIPDLFYAGDMVYTQGEVVQGGYSRFFRSANNGNTWQQHVAGLPVIFNVNDMLLDGTTIYAAMTEGLYKSTDFGNWTNLSANLPETEFNGVAKKGNRIIAVGQTNISEFEFSGSVHYSDDEGATWTDVSAQFGMGPYTTVVSVHVAGDFVLVSLGWQLWISMDNAETFTQVTDGIGFYNGGKFFSHGPYTFLTKSSGLLASGDNGLSWMDISDNLWSNRVNDVTVHNGQLYIGTEWGGVWTRELNTLTVDVPTAPDQNLTLTTYPNPTANGVWVRLPEDALQGQIELIDALGRTAMTTVATGGSNQYINLETMPAGLYTVRCTSGGRVFTARIVVAR